MSVLSPKRTFTNGSPTVTADAAHEIDPSPVIFSGIGRDLRKQSYRSQSDVSSYSLGPSHRYPNDLAGALRNIVTDFIERTNANTLCSLAHAQVCRNQFCKGRFNSGSGHQTGASAYEVNSQLNRDEGLERTCCRHDASAARR